MNWSTLLCFQDTSTSDKMFYARGFDGLIYTMSSKEWDCNKYSSFFSFPSSQCECLVKTSEVVATTTTTAGINEPQAVTASNTLAATATPAAEPILANNIVSKDIETLKPQHPLQEETRGEQRRDDRREVRDDRRDVRETRRDVRDERSNDRRNDRRGM